MSKNKLAVWFIENSVAEKTDHEKVFEDYAGERARRTLLWPLFYFALVINNVAGVH